MNIFFIFYFLFFLSCTPKAPVIESIAFKKYWIRDFENSHIYKGLSLFLDVKDRYNSIKNIESIFLINDKRRLFWKLSKNNLETNEINSIKRLGSYFLLSYNNEFKKGSYKVVVKDKSKVFSDKQFFINEWGKKPDNKDFANLIFLKYKKNIKLETNFDKIVLQVYDRRNIFQYDRIIDIKKKDLSDLKINNFYELYSLKLYLLVFPNDQDHALISGPFYIKEPFNKSP